MLNIGLFSYLQIFELLQHGSVHNLQLVHIDSQFRMVVPAGLVIHFPVDLAL